MRVLQVINNTDRRGAQTFALALGRHLVEHDGMTVDTVALGQGGANPLPVAVLARAEKSITALRRLRDLTLEYDIVVAHGSTTLPATMLATLGGRAPWVYRNIGDPLYWSRTTMQKRRSGMLFRQADGVAALWQGSRDALVSHFGVRPERVSIIPNGIDTATFRNRPVPGRDDLAARWGLLSDMPVVAYVGALSPEKDVSTLIRALSMSRDLQLVLAGDGIMRLELEALAHDALPGRAVFLGTVSDSRPVYEVADVVALTSLSEGLPAVLIEAGVCERPSVATRVGGNEDVVLDGESGRLVRVGDHDAILSGIREALENRERWGRVAARHCIAHYDMGVVGDQWGHLLRERANSD